MAREHAKTDCNRRNKGEIWGAMVRCGHVTAARTARTEGMRVRWRPTLQWMSVFIFEVIPVLEDLGASRSTHTETHTHIHPPT